MGGCHPFVDLAFKTHGASAARRPPVLTRGVGADNAAVPMRVARSNTRMRLMVWHSLSLALKATLGGITEAGLQQSYCSCGRRMFVVLRGIFDVGAVATCYHQPHWAQLYTTTVCCAHNRRCDVQQEM